VLIATSIWSLVWDAVYRMGPPPCAVHPAWFIGASRRTSASWHRRTLASPSGLDTSGGQVESRNVRKMALESQRATLSD
jgi:hypothetical protein